MPCNELVWTITHTRDKYKCACLRLQRNFEITKVGVLDILNMHEQQAFKMD